MSDRIQDGIILSGEYKYCPKCGARMIQHIRIRNEIIRGECNYCSSCGARMRGEDGRSNQQTDFV